ncbi:MAG: hypothetical protein ACM30H_14385 [Clostridia bacterium]
MADTRILYFSADGHAVYRSSRGSLDLEGSFAADEAGLAGFREYLRGRKGALFAAVADLAGEDFHEDQVPYLRGSDRQAVVQRRLAQRYRDTRIAAALSLGQVQAGERKNERILLASFTNTEQLAPWLDALDEAGVRLAGVYSVPLLAPALAARLGVKGGRAFVITSNRAGLRQCYVEDGRLRFARLERVAEMAPQALAMFVRSETQRLAQYLVTLRALPRDGSPVHVLVVAPAGKRSAFEQVLVSDARLAFHTVDAAEAARKLRLSRVPEGMLAEALYLHLAAKHPPREQFASREDTRRYLFWRLQRGIVAAGALGFAACGLAAGSRWLEAEGIRTQAQEQEQQGRVAARQYERITAGFPVTQTSTENLKLAVVEFTRIAQRTASPEEGMEHVSQVLQQFPQMELEAMTWSVGAPERLPGAGAAPATQAAQPQPGAAKPAAQAATWAILEVSGRVNATQRNDYRGITDQVQRFAGALATSGYEIVRTQLPFDVTSEGTLTGDIGGSSETASGEAPRFTITVARRLP